MKIFLFLHFLISTSLANEAEVNTKKSGTFRKSYTSLNISYVFWQEKMDVMSGSQLGKMNMQFQGFKVGYSYNQPFPSVRWVQHYTGEFAFGNAKGEGLDPISDELKNQSWLSLAASAGVLYRSSAHSEIILSLPLIYKKPNWRVTSPLNIDNKPFSVGISGSFVSRINLTSSLTASLTHQHLWGTTLWSIGYQYDFRK